MAAAPLSDFMLKTTCDRHMQSETSNLFSQCEKIGHSNPLEKRAGGHPLPHACGMTTMTDPHLGCEQNQNVVSNNSPVLFGIASIFSMPVDFTEFDGVSKGK
jgi:hypothetical protein